LNLLKILQKSRPERLIWEKENSGVTVQVLEKEGRRELRFGNHIMQSVFSTVNPDYLVLPYTRFMLLGLLFCPEPKSVLHIGLGGGSIVRWMHREFPETNHTVIEKNSAVIEAARRFFELPQDNRLRLLKADVTEIIPTLTEKFDIILLDAYTDFGAPEEVKRVEFLRNLRGCLNSTGWLAGNTWTMTGDFLEQCEIWKSTFTQVLQARANLKGNVILLGSQISQLPDKKNYQETAKMLNKRHRLDFRKMLSELKTVI
jgi:spermidine synthase|tara:strand:+ start:8 stop:781 length:774 start_codon:yes stop_codon:yes gene_type:complete